MWNQVQTLLSKFGGLSRLTIFDDEWHANHGEAAKLLWGYRNWAEAKAYVQAYFPLEIVVANTCHSVKSVDGELQLPHLTAFEKCMMCCMFFRAFSNQKISL